MGKPVLDIEVNLVATSPNNVLISDHTDYDAIGIDPADVGATVQVYLPTGVLYYPAFYNTPQVNDNVNPYVHFDYTNLNDVDNPLTGFLLDNKGCFINGTYKIKLNWCNRNTGEVYEYVYEKKVVFDAPKIQIEQTSDCFCPKFRSTDLTNYGESVEIDYEHKINYPAETDENDITTELLDYTDTRLANGTYVTEITTTRKFPVVSVFNVTAQIKGKKSHKVDCKSICDIKCGINTLYDKYKSVCGKDKSEADRLFKLLNQATVLYTLLYLNNGCGDTSKSDALLSALKSILGDCDCGCTDCDEDIWVSGACGSSGTSEFDPSGIYDYIDNLNTQIVNNLNTIDTQITNIVEQIATLGNADWFDGLDTACLSNFPIAGTQVQNKQYIIDAICELQELLNVQPVARNDYSTIVQDTEIEKLLTANDFFTSDAEVTITTPPVNGTAVVLGDNKTVKYTPDANWTGTENIGYTLTDANGNTSTAIWNVIVNAKPAASCYTISPICNAQLYNIANKLQIVLANQTVYGGNTPTQEDYLIEIRDELNNILFSYTVSGSLTEDPTSWLSPINISSNWNNVRIVMTTSSENADGISCGTFTYESDSPYLISDISVSIFYGVDVPECIDATEGDTDQEIIQKWLAVTCTMLQTIENMQTQIQDLDYAGYNDISDTVTIGAKFTKTFSSIREYNDGTVRVNFVGTYTGSPVYGDEIITGLPETHGAVQIEHCITNTPTPKTEAIYVQQTGGSGAKITVGAEDLDASNVSIAFTVQYKKL